MKIANLIGLDKEFILASKSPRRKKLLESIGLDFKILESEFDEDQIDNDLIPEEYVIELALGKANAVAEKIDGEAIIFGADTIVVFEGEKLNKPKDAEEAKLMLRRLSGATHTVYTGIAFVSSDFKSSLADFARTEVTFRDLEEDEIEAYVKSGSPLDKAGAYGIQDDFGACIVKKVNGCFYNVVGLPLELFYGRLKDFISDAKI